MTQTLSRPSGIEARRRAARPRFAVATLSELPFVRSPAMPADSADPEPPEAPGSYCVVPTTGAIVPAVTGDDIGCGITALPTHFTVDDIGGLRRSLVALRNSIQDAVEVALSTADSVDQRTTVEGTGILEDRAALAGFDPGDYCHDWRSQLGTLGGRSDTVIVSTDESGKVWVAAHSASREVGRAIAKHHRRTARRLTERYRVDLPHRDLAYLVEGTAAFDSYLTQCRWAESFAAANRDELVSRALWCLAEWLGATPGLTAVAPVDPRIDSPHNFIKREHHFGQPIWVSCRRAISAHRGVPGVVASSTRSEMLVVEGDGEGSTYRRFPVGAFSDSRWTAPPVTSRSRRPSLMVSSPGTSPSGAPGGEHASIGQSLAEGSATVRVHHVLEPLLVVGAAGQRRRR